MMKEINYDQFLKIPRDSWPPLKSVNIHCKFKQLKVIENVLRRENEYDKFQGSCFKYFLRVPEHQMFSAQLVHNLLLREISLEGANPDEMWFSIGGKKTRFSKIEFCLVTGLKFGTLSDLILKEYVPIKDGIHQRYFNGDMNLRLTHINERFQQGGFTRPWDCLKMALVLIANNVFFGQDYRRKVAFWLLALVENLQEFNDFAWGHYVFKLTVYYLRLSLGRHNLYGFPWALQIWAMEAIISMRNIFAERLPSSRPRFLKWSLKKRPKLFEDTLKELEKNGEFTAKEKLRPTRLEMNESYWAGINIDLSLGPQFVPLKGLDDDEGVLVDLADAGGGEQLEDGNVRTSPDGYVCPGEPVEDDHMTIGQVGISMLPTTTKKGKTIPKSYIKAARQKRSCISFPSMDLNSQLACFPRHAPPQPSPCPQSLDDIAMLREAIDAIPQQIEDVVKQKIGAFENCFMAHIEALFRNRQPTCHQQGLDDVAMLRQAIDAIPQHIEDVVKQKIGALENRIMARIVDLFRNGQSTSPQRECLQNIGNDNFPNPEVVESEINATSSDVVATKHVPANEVRMVEAIATSPVAPEVDAAKDVTVKEIVQCEEVAAKHVHANEVQKVKTVATSEVALVVDAVKEEAAKEIVQNEVAAASAEDMCGKEVAPTNAVVAASVMPRTEVQSE